MAEHNPADLLPKIVITEPSPFMPITNTGFVKNVPQMPAVEAVVPTVPEPTVSKEADPKETIIGESVSVSASDESCSVSVEGNRVVEADVATTEMGLLTPPQDEEVVVEDEFRADEGLYASCCRWMEHFSESKFMLPVLIVLLVMPISAGFMGSRYMDKCPLSPATPLFLYMLGVLGSLVILCRMGRIAAKMAGVEYRMPESVVVFGIMATLLLLCTEMTSFLRMSPNFEPGTPNYCHRIFYTFTYWLNWTSLFVILFLTVIHAPKCSRQTSQAENS